MRGVKTSEERREPIRQQTLLQDFFSLDFNALIFMLRLTKYVTANDVCGKQKFLDPCLTSKENVDFYIRCRKVCFLAWGRRLRLHGCAPPSMRETRSELARWRRKGRGVSACVCVCAFHQRHWTDSSRSSSTACASSINLPRRRRRRRRARLFAARLVAARLATKDCT